MTSQKQHQEELLALMERVSQVMEEMPAPSDLPPVWDAHLTKLRAVQQDPLFPQERLAECIMEASAGSKSATYRQLATGVEQRL